MTEIVGVTLAKAIRATLLTTLCWLLIGCDEVTVAEVTSDSEKLTSLPIIDMHLHAMGANDQGPAPLAMCTPIRPMPAWDPRTPYGQTFIQTLKEPLCDDPVWSPTTDEEVMERTLAVMKNHNVYGVLSGTREKIDTWMTAGNDRFFPGLGFNVANTSFSPEDIRDLYQQGKLSVLAEVVNQYSGILPTDDRMAPYWAMAEDLDLPVGIHIGPGPPGVIYLGSSNYRANMHSALTLEEVLVNHPKLRVYVMHAGFPFLEDTVALMYAHPQVYVEVGVVVYTQSRETFYPFLKGLVDAGFGNRVMFGSDQMVWPETLARSIEVIQEAPFLTEAQKRNIFYNNAARFLRLDQKTIDAHHSQ